MGYHENCWTIARYGDPPTPYRDDKEYPCPICDSVDTDSVSDTIECLNCGHTYTREEC